MNDKMIKKAKDNNQKFFSSAGEGRHVFGRDLNIRKSGLGSGMMS